ncbi:hypothetical protein HMH01_16910 [Halovulum dunhuangense]|uniref:OmpR/PhoB-type domain-containing protein n=1 Tax=Halovulum dunhuangense TaxID=1505036 RepID=A0A849L7Q8_9RHOB|nr:winged helix-turn-helix domain-containing protein [Halovulum dunhuangense]NNU82120.1 hypothetical protein [Halovulum dunhuangense]
MNASDARIGHFVLNRRLGRLEDGSPEPPHLRPKSYRVLEVLLDRRGRLVSRDDLISAVWTDVTVTEESLSQCISDIRRALGKDAAHLLRTVPRRGYVLETEPSRVARAYRRKPVVRAGAILVTAGLAGIGIAALSSAIAVPDRAARLQARPDAQDMLAVAPHDPDWRDRAANDARQGRLEAALAQDPDNAAAWAALAETYWLEVKHAAWGGGRRELDKALAALERAMALDGGARAYRILSEVRLDAPFRDTRSRVDALAIAKAAVTLAPNDPDALVALAAALTANDRAGEALPVLERARTGMPVPSDRYREIAGMAYLLAGAPARAAEEFGRLQGAGTFGGPRHDMGWFLAASLAHAGQIDRARIVVEATLQRRPERTRETVALSLDRMTGQRGLDVVLDGLRLAGLPG